MMEMMEKAFWLEYQLEKKAGNRTEGRFILNDSYQQAA